MDLIYMNGSMEDIGVLQNYEFDLAFGADENSFACHIQAADHCCKTGYYLYIEGTEYGGIIDSITSDTDTGEVIYSGRTWHGILNSKIICPDTGKDYLVLSGEPHMVLRSLLQRLALTGLFSVSTVSTGLTIGSYQMPRYIAGYDGIKKLLATVGCKLLFNFAGGHVVLTAWPKADYTDTELDSDITSFRVQHTVRAVNHLICLGKGELSNRMVVHLYSDPAGNISQTQSLFGLDEYTAVYDYPNVESASDLMAGGRDRLKELGPGDSMSIDLTADEDIYDIGDLIGAVDNVTGITATAEIKKKVITIQNGQVTISYEVGD